MGWQTTSDLAGFLAAAGEYLRRDRARNTVILTVTEQLRRGGAGPGHAGAAHAGTDRAPLFGWWTGDGGGAFMHTPPFPLLLCVDSLEAAAGLAAALAGRPLAGVNAGPEAARAFAATWREGSRGQVAERGRQRLYRLGRLSWPDPVPEGAPRVAESADLSLLAGWLETFAAEVHEPVVGGDARAAVRERLAYGGITLWEAGGAPVAMAAVTRQVAGMIRIGQVYTPPPRRSRGYASAVTAQASRRAVTAGAEEVLLYTDLANPVSNSIYQRIGYRPVEDRLVLAFSAADLPAAYLALTGTGGIIEGIRSRTRSFPLRSALCRPDRPLPAGRHGGPLSRRPGGRQR